MIHTFHIPVMGLAYTIDTPIKVAHYGISSVISIGDDFLIEKARNYYAKKFSVDVPHISRKDENARSRFITTYLDLVQEIVNRNWHDHIEKLISDRKYRDNFFRLLPHTEKWQSIWETNETFFSCDELRSWSEANFPPGSIDVNIMTKLDNRNSLNGKELPVEFNDAHASLRGYALSNLTSSVVLSAGMNLSLLNYIQKFRDFKPDNEGKIRKKIILKVSDYRSAIVQGKILAKRGLWVSEFRIESGLNCGGHAFPTQGNLMGPILEEFKSKRLELYKELNTLYVAALKSEQGIEPPVNQLMRFSAQGGVGTSAEHNFLLEYFALDSVGWGSPFLLVPEAVSIDKDTLARLAAAKEDDLYLSNASPIGVPFNNLRNSTRQLDQKLRITAGKPGSPCTKKFLKLNTEFGGKAICTASTKYIVKSIARLEKSKLPAEIIEREKEKIYEKECLCCGLALPFLEEHKLEKKLEGKGVTICPGPNIAYFDREYSLSEMINHIYGKINLISRVDRPHMFLKEAQLYLQYLKDKNAEFHLLPDAKSGGYIKEFKENIQSGIRYYLSLFQSELPLPDIGKKFRNILKELEDIFKEKDLLTS